MRFVKFEIENFKGIQQAVLDLSKAPSLKIFTLVGLNESGKTTILEAINSFSPDREGVEILYQDVIKEVKPEDLVPKAKKANFSEKVIVRAFVEVTPTDRAKIDKFCHGAGWQIDLSKIPNTLKIEHVHEFKNSTLIETETYWFLDTWLKKKGQRRFSDFDSDTHEWQSTVDFIRSLIPQICYFPTFIFDFPERIYLSNPPKDSKVNAYYLQIVQDILDSLPGDKMSVRTHIVERVENAFAPGVPWNPFEFFRSDRNEQIDHVMLQISDKVTEVVFNRWNDIFGVKVQDKVVDVAWKVEDSEGEPSKKSVYLTFSIRDGRSKFAVSERSLGFRWFFCFLLFTQFRASRKDSAAVFLFDEPASNLHSRAQEQLLKSFFNISTGNNAIIYSTHSHYMIEPRWLEGAFIVFNDAIDYEGNPAEEARRKIVDTNIHVSRYRDFVGQNPDKVTYFQPILDTLQYAPSRLELGKEAIFVEGKNDFYMLQYFSRILKLENPCHFIPASGAGSLSPLISIYLGWTKNFLALLDDDKAGRAAKGKYCETFLLDSSKVLTLGDLSPKLSGKKIEAVLSEAGRKIICNHLGVSNPSKKDLGRFFQEKFALDEAVEFDKETVSTVTSLLQQCSKRMRF